MDDLPATMKAIVMEESAALGLQTVEVPEVGDTQVLVEVQHSGICGTDIHIIARQYTHPLKSTAAARDTVISEVGSAFCTTDPNPWTRLGAGEFKAMTSGILGHEFWGYIRKVGSGVTELKVGTPVAVDPNEFCS